MRKLLWTSPLLLFTLFLVGDLVLESGETQDKARKTLEDDARSLRAQLLAAHQTEAANLTRLAASLPTGPDVNHQEVLSARLDATALLRDWRQLDWVIEHSQAVASWKRVGSAQSQAIGPSQTVHLAAPVGAQQGPTCEPRLVASYELSRLLNDERAGWLKNKYRAELLTDLGQVLGSTTPSSQLATGESYVLKLDLTQSVPCRSLMSQAFQLRLTQLQPPPPVYRGVPDIVALCFLVLTGVTTVLLRSQVTQVSRLEIEARTEAAWRAAMEDSALVGLRARDAAGRLLHVNQTFCQMVGYTSEELVGRCPPMPYWAKGSREETMMRSARNLEGKAPREGYVTHWEHRSGRVIHVVMFESPLVDAQGVQIGWMGSIVDITKQKNEGYKRKKLEEKVRQDTETLTKHARLAMVGEVASTLAHELSQPLSAIASYNAGVFAALSKQPEADPELLDVVDRVSKHAEQAGRILHRIRTRLSQHDPAERCDLNKVVKGVVYLLKRDLERAQVRVSLQLADDLSEVSADRAGIEQVVTNLVRNAIDALASISRERQITITSARASAPPGTAYASAVRVGVADNGPGIGGQSLERLVEPFYSGKPAGMGLGLSICRSILEAYGGTLHAEECASGGAYFYLTFPSQSMPTENRA